MKTSIFSLDHQFGAILLTVLWIMILLILSTLVICVGFEEIDNYNENKDFCKSKGGFYDSIKGRCIKDNLMFEVVKDSEGRRHLAR